METQPNALGILRVFRIEEGTTVHARTLSDGYLGLFTHYVKRRSVLCQGEDCEAAIHRAGKIWKGYAAVELWNAPTNRWNPFVLEITESLELDLRGIWKRGQVWEFYRELPVKKKSMPISGKLLEERDPTTVPPAFDFRPVLLHLYHVHQIHLGALNPMPPRVIVKASEGDGPAILSSERNGTPTVDPEVERQFQEFLRTGKKTPTEKKLERA